MTLSIWVPVGYIGALVLSLSLFSSVYRKRSARNAAKGSEEPWHPEGHPERDVYQSLIAASTSGVELPDHLLKAALLNRAMTDVKRIIQMRDDKQALAVLLQKGSVGDATMTRFALAEKELEAEILDVVSEANTFREGWGQLIFPTASEMVTHKKHKEAYYSIPEERNKQIALLKAQNKPIPKPTIELPPLFTPPGTQVKVHAQQPPQGQGQGPPGAVGPAGVPLPPGMSPAQMQQIIQAQRAARSQQLGQAPPGQGNAAAAVGPQPHGPPRPPTGPAAEKTNGGMSTPPVVKSGEGDATGTPAATATIATASAPPLTPSSKGNSNSTTNGSATAPSTPAAGEDSTAAIGSESFDSTLDDDDDDDEGGDSGEEGSAPAGTASPGGGGGGGGGANRAQRRQNKKKQKKGGKK
ncbi:hypothetical protein BCV69DRAFT_279761 [Microstroma glucosiphilum]|uniref:Translocation protein sec66 n=1 Tax=Pseudomicrostroma glucosiphilum TaxID=1684307 RepID=A0A316UF32_9BASI|nr:hypothetical protein BCV69DRAFT_279761 [Pseudomicrostroma glucosiphilum]PWN23852.1 hypothetical protein BCV69DRAFT_279761 [Pseudomicrostroma glucosiphilum]